MLHVDCCFHAQLWNNGIKESIASTRNLEPRNVTLSSKFSFHSAGGTSKMFQPFRSDSQMSSYLLAAQPFPPAGLLAAKVSSWKGKGLQ